MRNKIILGITVVAAALGTAVIVWGNSNRLHTANQRSAADRQRIAALLADMAKADLNSMQALEVKRFEVPHASVDVMRVKLEETYDVKGIGTDTVQLQGWIAVVHDNARPAEGETEARWGTAISDTEFVGMSLHGESQLFGPVTVELDPMGRSVGQVGKLQFSLVDQLLINEAYGKYRGLGVTAKPVVYPEPVPEPAPAPPQPAPKGNDAIKATINNVLKAVSDKDAKAMLAEYSKNPSDVFFNGALGTPVKGADQYINQLSKMFANIKTIHSIADENMNIKVSGKLATAAVTGRNEIVDTDGNRGTAPWQWTVQLEQQGSHWLITHDHLTFGGGAAMDVKSLHSPLAACGANVSVAINMPKLDLRMRTQSPVTWYSEVETIPPVGYTASVSFTPTPLLADGREVATLTSGVVKFREVVRHVNLDGTTFSKISH
jgi:uncharacterized protein (TIGR02246 family)